MLRKFAYSILAFLGLGMGAAQAQTAVQAVPQHLDAAQVVQSSTAAVNTALTVTVPGIAGQFFYVTNLTLQLCQDTTASTSLQLAVTTTNLNGWLTQIGQPSSAGRCDQFPFVYPNGLKSAAAGTATVVTVGQPGTHGAAIVSIAGYYGF